jgi:hypothetical protein
MNAMASRIRDVSRTIVLIAIVMASVVGASEARPPSVSVRLSVVRCPTSYGTPTGKSPAIPATVTVSSSARNLAAYSNGWMLALAPRGWHCSGGVGADGNEGLTILPPYVSTVTAAAAAVTAFHQWNGVAVYTACPFFPELARGTSFPCAISRRELVGRLGARDVGFEDPPGVHGSGDPSGGALPANGVVAYTYVGTKPSNAQITVGSETCTLPKAQHAACTAVLNDFLGRWKR